MPQLVIVWFLSESETTHLLGKVQIHAGLRSTAQLLQGHVPFLVTDMFQLLYFCAFSSIRKAIQVALGEKDEQVRQG